MNTNIDNLLKNNEILASYFKEIFIKTNETKWFLDLSCGTRDDIRQIVESFGWKYIGVDIISYKGVIKADAHSLPFKNALFDVVYSAAAFEHYYNPWKVSVEVNRVIKQNGYFCGLIAFIQPWHSESYFHFTHLGSIQMLNNSNFKVLDIRSGNLNGIVYLMRSIFPHCFRFIGNFLSIPVKLLFFLRLYVLPLIIKIFYMKNNYQKNKKLKFLMKDKLRYAASVVFLAKKSNL